jgi:hypothetical protein
MRKSRSDSPTREASLSAFDSYNTIGWLAWIHRTRSRDHPV